MQYLLGLLSDQIAWEKKMDHSDNAFLMKSLTAWAEVLKRFDVLSSKQYDDFETTLSAIATQDDRLGSLLLEPLVQESMALKVMVLRYGQIPVGANLLRASFRSDLGKWSMALQGFALMLLEKSNLVFNRNVSISQDGKLDHRVLYSKVLVDSAENLAIIVRDLIDCQNRLALLIPNSLDRSSEKDQKIDEAVATALGFSGVFDNYFWQLENQALLNQALDLLIRSIECLKALGLTLQTDSEKLEAYMDDCRWSLVWLKNLRLMTNPTYKSLCAYEQWRARISQSLESSHSGLLRLLAPWTNWIGLNLEDSLAQKTPANLGRRVTYDLFSVGSTFDQAKKASSELLTYLNLNDLKSTDLLASEVAKIHPVLKNKVISYLHEPTHELLSVPAAQKSLILKKAKSLLATLDQHKNQLGSSLVLFFAVLFLAGCGLKTSVKSDQLTPRPEIPFKNEAE